MIYNLIIYLMQLGVAIASLFNEKVRKMWRGEHEAFSILKEKVDPNAKYAWFHAASLGEFEQGRPIMEQLRQEHQHHRRDDGPRHISQTAQHHIYKEQDRGVEVEFRRYQRRVIESVERAGRPRQTGGDDEREHLGAEDLDAHGFRGDAVVPGRHDRTAAAGIHQMEHDDQRDQDQHYAGAEGRDPLGSRRAHRAV